MPLELAVWSTLMRSNGKYPVHQDREVEGLGGAVVHWADQ